MKQKIQFEPALIEKAKHDAELDLVVPVTTPELTRAALKAADHLGAGLNAIVRLIKVQVIPYPLDLTQSPVYIGFLKEQLAHFESELPLAGEIVLARDLHKALLRTIEADSVVVLASHKRPWKTSNERLARALTLAGRKVLLVSGKEKKPCSTFSTVY